MKLKGLFLNTCNDSCSIYESGVMSFDCLKNSEAYQLDYVEINEQSRSIKPGYDFYVFNYHPTQMAWLSTNELKTIPGKKYTIVLETEPNNPFICVNDKDFDGYIVLDPSITLEHPKVFAFARPLELKIPVKKYVSSSIPVIGSFGFATPGKGFELMIDAVNREFDNALIRINIPPVNDITKDYVDKLFNKDYVDYLEELCKKIAKPGIEVDVTRDFLSKEDLINWCASNTLNCFMYHRFKPGLSATTDQAIVSGRPLAVSANETFRHLHQYIKPYPFRSLKESIEISGSEVLKIQKDWTETAFQKTFVNMLHKTGCSNVEKEGNLIKLKSVKEVVQVIEDSQTVISRVESKVKSIVKTSYNKLRNKITSQSMKPGFLFEAPLKKFTHKLTILLVSHSYQNDEIYRFGWNLKEALKKSAQYHFCYVECSNPEELNSAILQTNPAAIVYNYNRGTLPWITKEIISKYSVPQIGYVHEFDQKNLPGKLAEGFFDYYLFPDPSLDVSAYRNCFTTGRLLANYQNETALPLIPTIGSFGFGFKDKGFERLVTLVQHEFDEAVIRLHMPFSHFADPDGTFIVLPTAERCRKLIAKPGIQLQITHDYLSKEQVLNFLAANSINAFLYDIHKDQGISSALDYALSVQRPIAITSAGMFRHMGPVMDNISVEKNSLHAIIERDIAPLVPFYNQWDEAHMIITYENLLNKIHHSQHTSVKSGNLKLSLSISN